MLVLTSVLVYVIQYSVFHDTRDMLFYFLQDLAFLPIQVLLVGLFIERIIAQRERSRLLQKMNMVIGTFFSELGVNLLGMLSDSLGNKQEIRPYLAVHSGWKAADWKRALSAAERFDYAIDTRLMNLVGTKELLSANRNLLILLLANPNLMEHEKFTDLLWAVSHLMEELFARKSLDGLPASDLEHLAGDIKRVYSQLTVQWLLYCRHLQRAYPYIFSIIVRTHPLQDHPSAIVK